MVPNFHLAGHKEGCHSPFSLHWLWGAGSASTKLMGLGARFAALEGLFGFHNFRRLVAHRLILKRRMAEAIKEGKTHKESFEAFSAGLKAAMPAAVEEWREWVETYEKTCHVEKERRRPGAKARQPRRTPDAQGVMDSPYEYDEIKTTLKDVRLKLASEEYDQTGDGYELEREDTPSTFLCMGMDIEESQRQLAVDIKAAGPHPTTTQQLDVLKRRTQLRGRIKAFRKLQKSYMPNLRRHLTASQRLAWDADGKEPESTRLFMPSDLSSQAACVKACGGVARLPTGLIAYEDRNNTLQGILRLVNLKIHGSKLRYRYARQALLKLKDHGDWEKRFQALTEDDVRALNERSLTDEEKAERERLMQAGEVPEEGGIAEVGNVVSGETHRTLSWIWYSVSDKTTEDGKLHDALRVEWCKAYSRSRRWREELVLLEEEMRRTIEYGEWAERRWVTRSTARTVMLGSSARMTAEVAEGVRAYALKQADRERRTCERLRADWATIRGRGDQYLKGENIAGQPAIVIEVDRDSLRFGEALAYEREEVENDMYQ
ncbi:hypothetical protein C8R46DRAFT_1234781 [Mycena filopes]|nr:hypothetical protein C8R46DRAFT_1234781 [Mycena filopes]